MDTNCKVIMIGPGQGVVGGITAVTNTIVPGLMKQVDLTYFESVKERELRDSGRFSVKNIFLAVSQFTRFFGEMLRTRPQIVHLHTSHGLGWLKDTLYIPITKLFGSKFVLHIHAADYKQLVWENNKLLGWYSRSAMRQADLIVTVSEEWEKLIAQIAPAEKIVTLRNCIDTKEFDLKRNTNGKTCSALFLGSVGDRKGTFDLIRAVALLSDQEKERLQVMIAGGEESHKDLQKAAGLIDDLGLGEVCKLVGVVRGQGKLELLAGSNLFVLPSYREGLPMAILEAMASGQAVLSTMVGGIPEVVREGHNGYLVQPGDIQGIAEKISILLKDEELLLKMGENSRSIALEELDVVPYLEQLIQQYAALL